MKTFQHHTSYIFIDKEGIRVIGVRVTTSQVFEIQKGKQRNFKLIATYRTIKFSTPERPKWTTLEASEGLLPEDIIRRFEQDPRLELVGYL